jgi:hypothetical protein
MKPETTHHAPQRLTYWGVRVMEANLRFAASDFGVRWQAKRDTALTLVAKA